MPPEYPNKRRSPRNFDINDKIEYNLVNSIDPFIITPYKSPIPNPSISTSSVTSYIHSELNFHDEPYKSLCEQILLQLMILCLHSRPKLFKEWIPLDEILLQLDLHDNNIPRYFDRLLHHLITSDLLITRSLHLTRYIALHPDIQSHLRNLSSTHLTEIDLLTYIHFLFNSL